MAIDIPVPKIIADVGEGGPFVTTMKGLNALTKQNLDAHMQRLENKYYPQKMTAETASKLAYANLMGPQFLSKLMQNDSILANLPDAQKADILNRITRAGTGQTSGNNMLNQTSVGQSGSQQPSGPQGLVNALMGNDINKYDEKLSPEDQQRINKLAPGNTYVDWLNQANQGAPATQEPEFPTSPGSSFTENVGKYKGVVKEGEESGKIRAKDIKDLNDLFFNGQTNQATLDDVSSILASPEFEQIRQIPLAGHHELSYYSKLGTPAQQQMVGQYFTLTGNIIKDSARDFAGAFRKGEQQLLSGMKPNPSDTVDTARGKVEALSIMNKLLTERARLTSGIMSKYHVNKLQAQEMADKQINGSQIRQEIHNKLNPTVTIRNKKTGELKTISISEARKLGVPNV